MNAYELADLLQTTESTNNQAANMLRQQADRIAELEKYWADAEVFIPRHHELALERIAELEKEKQEAALQRLSDFTQSAEPVAWMSQGGDVSRSANYFEEMGFKDLIPLYTTPHHASDVKQTKPLSDEEIERLAKRHGVVGLHEDAGLYEFARGILNHG